MRLSRRIITGLIIGVLTLALITALTLALVVQPFAPTQAATTQNLPAAQATATSGADAKGAAQAKEAEYIATFSKSLADHLGVDEAKLNAAFVAAVSDTADKATQDNQLSATQAAAIKQRVQQGGLKAVAPIIFKALSGQADEPLKEISGTAFMGAANALGYSPQDFKQTLATKSIAELAQERNIDLQKVKDAMLAAVKSSLDESVKAGKLSQAEADDAYKGAPNMIDKLVTSKPSAQDARDQISNPKTMLLGAMDEVAKLLGLSRADLDKAWQSASLADIASAHNVEVAKVKDTMLNSFKSQLDAIVKSGKLSQADADAVYQKAAGMADDFINSLPNPDGSRRNKQ